DTLTKVEGVKHKQKVKVFLLIAWLWFLGFSAYAIPIMSNIELTSLSDSSMVITWSTTNEASSTEIIWGSGGLTDITTVEGSTKYHRVELTGLYQNTTYQYRIKSGIMIFPPEVYYSPASFTTLTKPSGEYLFSFAVLNDIRYAEGKANVQNARGIPYEICDKIVSSEVADVNRHGVAFTVVNGNLAENSGTYGDQIGSNPFLKGELENLSGASDLPVGTAYKYLPNIGYEDKTATYTNDWFTNGYKPLTTDPGSSESRYTAIYGYNVASKDADSVFNYQFKYHYYNFIFLDSVKAGGTGGAANLGILNSFLSTEANSKTFIFMSFPGYNPLDASTKDYPLDIPTSEVGGGIINIENAAAFRATLEAYEDAAGNPIVAAVISGHLGDNYKRDINSISYVRQGPALQYPTGYSIYKVYSTGYVKTFYKTTGGSIEADGDTKPYYEYARDQISTEVVSGQTLPKAILTQFWLGSSSNRNFTYTYDFIPGLAPAVISTAPTSNESAVTLNSPLLISFNKRMTTQDLGTWVTIRDSSNNAVTVSSESFLDSSRTILKVSHSDFVSNEVYAITVSASKAKDEGLTPMSADYIFSFNTTGAVRDDQPPVATVYPLPDNTTTDPYPNFTGIATDDSRVIIVQYRIGSSGSWLSTEAVDGAFTSTTEVFQIRITEPLSAGIHQLWLKTSDGAGNTSAEGFSAYTFTYIVGNRPSTTSFLINGSSVYPGDTINSRPSIEVVITSSNSLESGRITIDSVPSALSFIKVDNNYYSTHEVTTALANGSHTITVEAFDILGNGMTYEVTALYTQSSSSASIQGVPLNYPNPFNPSTQTTRIGYTLSKDSNVTLNIFDLHGNLIIKNTYSSGQTGGKAGYNEITWDGKASNNSTVGNGIYLYFLIADGQVVQNGKGKLTVFR
ncbi:MAG: Ig-like domain-containing protein, partial [Candidatus Margulisbacteria bacterium]|nr:Ig-like domain-containing protein [Candidatus Margulisiibacteriota bacterium]